MNWLRNFFLKLALKRAVRKLGLKEGIVENKRWYQSKTVLTAIVAAVLSIAQAVGTATGHPVVVPDWVYQILGAFGLYSLRVGDKPIV